MERMTFDFCIAGQHCWQVHGADNNLCGEVCEQYGEKGCNNCPLGQAINRLAAYENSRIPPDELQEVADLFKNVIDDEVPVEVKRWMDRCIWHVQKCNELRKELAACKAELQEFKKIGMSPKDLARAFAI